MDLLRNFWGWMLTTQLLNDVYLYIAKFDSGKCWQIWQVVSYSLKCFLSQLTITRTLQSCHYIYAWMAKSSKFSRFWLLNSLVCLIHQSVKLLHYTEKRFNLYSKHVCMKYLANNLHYRHFYCDLYNMCTNQ